MADEELYRELGALTKDKSRWEENIPYVASLLSHGSVRIRAKALWLLGEMGLAHPDAVQGAVPGIAAFLESPVPLLRSRAATALGRIGRGSFPLAEPYLAGLFRLAADEDADVRLGFIWASENIAANSPDVYGEHMRVFADLLRDGNVRVRMEAPEMFRVLGKRRPDLVLPYIGDLLRMAETDPDRVVRIHCLGAAKTVERP